MDWLSQELDIAKLDDWYSVSLHQLIQFSGTSPFSRYGGLFNVLKEVYPDYNWNVERFEYATLKWRRVQWKLFTSVAELLGEDEELQVWIHRLRYIIICCFYYDIQCCLLFSFSLFRFGSTSVR